jgi:hypothetical protein
MHYITWKNNNGEEITSKFSKLRAALRFIQRLNECGLKVISHNHVE